MPTVTSLNSPERNKPVYTPMFSCPQEKIDTIKNWRNIQAADGNWNAHEYGLGLYIGIEICLALLEDREPEHRELPHPVLNENTGEWTTKDYILAEEE